MTGVPAPSCESGHWLRGSQKQARTHQGDALTGRLRTGVEGSHLVRSRDRGMREELRSKPRSSWESGPCEELQDQASWVKLSWTRILMRKPGLLTAPASEVPGAGRWGGESRIENPKPRFHGYTLRVETEDVTSQKGRRSACVDAGEKKKSYLSTSECSSLGSNRNYFPISAVVDPESTQ